MYESLLRIYRGLNGEDIYVDVDYEKLKKHFPILAPLETCPDCKGNGCKLNSAMFEYLCVKCNGTGKVSPSAR